MSNVATQQQPSLDNHKPALDELAALTKQKKEIDARIKALGEEVRPVLADKGKVMHNGFVFNCTLSAGRTTYDYKAMTADGIDVDKYKKVGAPFTTLKIEEVTQA